MRRDYLTIDHVDHALTAGAREPVGNPLADRAASARTSVREDDGARPYAMSVHQRKR
jgi:hypothetical protein